MSLTVLLVLLLAVLGWLLGTTSGARAALSLGNQFTGETIVARVTGRLLGPLELTDVRLEFAAGSLTAEKIVLDYLPQELLAGRLSIAQLRGEGLQLVLNASAASVPADESSTEPPLPPAIPAPMQLAVESFRFQDVQIVSGETVIDLARLAGALSWRDTAVDLHSLELVHALGRFESSGQIELQDGYQLNIDSTLSAQHPELAEINAHINTDGELLEQLAMTVELGPPYSSRAELALTDVLRDASIRSNLVLAPAALGKLYKASPAPLNDATLAGTLDLGLDLGADVAPGGWRVLLDEIAVQGTAMGENLQLGGAVEVSDSALLLQDVRLSWSGVDIKASSALGDDSAVEATFEIADLTTVVGVVDRSEGDPLEGALQGRVVLSGAMDNPLISASVTGTGLTSNDLPPQDVALEVNGSADSHRFELAVTGAHTLHSAGTGVLADNGRWQFLLTSLRLGTLSLGEPFAFAATNPLRGVLSTETAGLSLEPFCLVQQPVGPTEICAELSAPEIAAASPRFQAQITAFDLALLNSLLPADSSLIGTINGQLDWTGQLGGSTIDLRADGLALQAIADRGQQDVVRFAPSRFSLAGDDDRATLSLNLPLMNAADESTGRITGDIQITGLDGKDPQAAQLDGELAVELVDLAGLLAVAGLNNSEIDGNVAGAVQIAGTIAEPQLQGEAQLEVATLRLPELGIEVADSRVGLLFLPTSVSFDGSAQTRSIAARSVQGGVVDETPLSIAGRLDWREELAVEAAVTGRSILALDRSDALVRVSPELQIGYSSQGIKVRGQVAVPLAELEFKKLPSGVVHASADQIIVGQPETAPGPAIDANVRVALGERVSFTGLGLAASFAGDLRVQQRANGLPTALGEIRIIDGSYQAYGQDLSVKDGRLIFVGGPLDEPGIDLRAIRQATPEIQVGVHALGSLAAPEFSTFSTPALPQSDQLSYLVLGRPMTANSAAESSVLQQAAMALGVKGGELLTNRLGDSLGLDTFAIESAPGAGNAQAALVIGKYLSPRLYVSYGYGLFEPVSTLRFDYQLNSVWRIVTESSNGATGGDINFVKER